jgi:hypothetical protein
MRLSCGAFASAIAVRGAGHLREVHLDDLPAGAAEFGTALSQANRDVVRIGDERATKSEYVGCARRALFRRPLRERGDGPRRCGQQAQGYEPPRQRSRSSGCPSVWAFRFHQNLAMFKRGRCSTSARRHRYAVVGARACREMSAFVAFDPAAALRHVEWNC